MRKIQTHPNRRRSHSRSGLAPLEMVMLTPLLVLMGALMICFGDAALWKIRAQAAAHYQATQTESFRAAYYDANSPMNPRPVSWPGYANMGGEGRGDIDPQTNPDFLDQSPPNWSLPGGKGEALEGSSGGKTDEITYLNSRLRDSTGGDWGEKTLVVNRRMILQKGVHAGTAEITKTFPMLTRLLPNNGRFRVDHDMESLDGDWDFANLGLGWNGDRRAFHLYNDANQPNFSLDPSINSQLRDLWKRFNEAYRNLVKNTDPNLKYLDNDREWLIYHSRASRPPDYHVTPQNVREIDLSKYVTSGEYKRYLDRVRRVPRRMARDWLDTYSTEYGNRQDPNYTPKGPLKDSELLDRITVLSNFLNYLSTKGY
jgi:hypothetical protein